MKQNLLFLATDPSSTIINVPDSGIIVNASDVFISTSLYIDYLNGTRLSLIAPMAIVAF